jgi:hypothetical protein
MNEELQSLVERAMAAGRSREQILTVLKDNGLDDAGALAVDSYIKKKSPSALEESASQSDLRPSVSESLSSERVQLGFDEAAIKQQKKAIADAAAAQVYTAVAQTKGDLNKIQDKQAFANAYTTYRSLSDDPRAAALPQNPVTQTGEVDYAVVPTLKKGAIDYVNELIKQEQQRKADLGSKFTVPVLSEVAAGAESIVGGLLKFNEMITGQDSELASFFLDDAAERSRDALIDYGLTEEEISKGFLENIGEGNIGAGLTIFGSTLVQQVPQLAAVAATGGAAGLGLLGASAAGSGYAELQNRSDLSEGEKMLYGLGVGAAEYLAEKLFLGDVNMLRKAFSKEAIEGMTKKELGDMLFGAVPKGVRSVMEEGTEEVLTSVAQQTLAKVIAGEEFNPIEIAESAIYGGAAGGGVYLLSRGVGAIVDPENEAKIRGLRAGLKKTQEAAKDPDLTDQEKEVLGRRAQEYTDGIEQLKRRDDEKVASMTPEDQEQLKSFQGELKAKVGQLRQVKSDEAAEQLKSEVRGLLDNIKQISEKYDRQEEAGVPSPVVEGEAVVEAQPVEGAGQEATPAGRVLQAREKLILESIGMDATLQAVERGEEVEQSDVESTQERILQVIDDIDKSDISAEAKQAYIQTLEDKFDELEYYDNKTITTTQQVTEEVPVGAPRAGSRTVVEPEVRRGKLRLFERLNNLEVATGEETEGQTSVVETQDDGSIDVVTYDKKTKQEVSRQPRVAENILGLEYVESILDDNGNVTGVIMRPATAKGQDESPMRIRVVNRPELAMDIAIDARKKQIGDIPEVIWMQEYETVTREVTTKEKVPAKERPAAREKAPVAPAAEVTEEAVVEEAPTVEEEAVVEQEVKNRKGLSTEEVNEALSASERLAKRLGLGVIIVTHRTRKEYNNAMDELSKNGSVAEGVESGRFIPSRNEVHINLEDMNASVPFHEVFHAAFVNRFGKMGQKNREKIANDFYNGILNILRKGSESDNLLADAVESFVRSGNYTAKETPEEFLAQTAGFLSTSGDKISKSTMDKLIQWLNNFISKIAPRVKIVTQGDYIDFMNSFSGALFESSTEKSLDEIAEEGSYTPDEPAVMPDLSESASRFNEEKAPNWLKENIANLKSLAGRKIPFAVFYDNTRVGKSTLKNKVTGKESNRNLMGGFGYSQIEGVKFEDDGAKVSVLAFTNEDMAARKLSEYLRKEGDLIPVAMQNTQTGHLGNLDVVYEMFDDVEGVVSTAPALYAQQQTGKKSGPEFEAARKAAEDEILGAIKQSVVELAEKTEQNKKKTGPSDRVKAARSILPMLNDITTLADWRDKILLGEWDSFGTRGLFNAYMLQAKPSKETKSTREVHKILHGKYGVPTVKELADGITEESFNNAELGDVIKFVSPEKTPVIYTTDPVHKDLPKEGVQKKSDKMTYTLKYIGNQVDSHVSYPYILAGQNDGFAPSYIDITEIFPDLRGKVKKSQSFYAAGRRSLAAPVGELELTESSSRDVREEILDREQESRIDRAKRAATSFVWNPTQKKIRVFKERMTSQLSVEGREIKKLSKRMNALLSKADDETLGYVNDIMDGVMGPNAQRKLEAKPKGREIFTLANSMRNYIDSFANDFVNDPAFLSLPESIVETIIDNFGQYMRGSYRFWKDKNYKPTNEARREAIAYEYEIILAKKIEQLVKKEGFNEEEAGEFFELFHDETLAEATKAIDDYITEIEKIRNGDDFKKMGIISPSSIKLPSDEFTRRKNLPQTIKNLLGEEKDPLIRFVDTAIALSNIKYKGHMLYAISESLGGTNFIKNEATDAEVTSGEYRLVKDKFSPLNGRYVHKDVFEAITDPKIYEADNIWMQGYLSTLQLARKSKVIYNVPTWRKNLTGGWYTMVANGVVNPELVKDLYRRAQLFANGQTDPETEAWIKIMGDNGLIGQDVNANLIGFTNAMYSRTLTGNDQDYMTYMQRGRNLIKNFDTVVGQKYAAVDDYTKLIVFRTEVDSFAKKIYGKSYESLTAKQKETVHAEAAEFVKQNTPTFSRLPKWYANLAKVPAGDFLSFEFESLRSFTSNIYNGQQDLMKGMTDKSLTKEQKAEYIKAGTRRLVGSASIMGARMAITSVLAAAAMGDDDELTDDVKKNRPNWMEGHSIIPVGVTKDGIATVYDYSMEDPYGSFFDLATDPLSFPAYLTDLLQPNMGITFLMNLAENKDFYGRDITNSYDSKLTKGYKYTEHTLKSLIVPPFISSAYRDEQKRKEVEADKYSELDAVGRFASRMVIRDYQYNIGVQFYYFTDKFRTKKEQYSDLTGASRDNRLAELDEIKTMYQSIVNIGIKKGNYQMIADANKNVKRALKPLEEAYVLYGYELPEQK